MSYKEAKRQQVLKMLKNVGINSHKGQRIELLEYDVLLRLVALERVRKGKNLTHLGKLYSGV